MKKPDPIITGIIVIFLLIVGGVILAASRENRPITEYKAQETDRPKLEIGQKEFDFGQMKLTDVKIQEVPIKNSGTKPLIVSDFLTSCDCTFAQFVSGGVESPRFSMHRNPDWRGEIKPGETAIVRLIYEPRVMPVKGAVSREAVFKTNDPDQALVNLKFNAIVE